MTMTTHTPASAAARGIRGRLRAEFAPCTRGVTARISATPPLEMRGPFPGEAGPRYFVRNVTAGILAGDDYDIALCAEPGARVVVEPTAATKAYTMREDGARLRLRLEAHEGSALRYNAGLTILQCGSAVAQETELVRHPGGTLAYMEVVALGRLARGERLAFRRYTASLRVVTPDGRTLYSERCDLQPDIDGAALDMAVGGYGVIGTLVLAGIDARPPGPPDRRSPGVYAGMTELPNGAGTLVRVLARRAEDATRVLGDYIAR